MNILITGLPRSGKTTLLKDLLSRVEHRVGFYTHELRVDGLRTWFEIVASSGERGLLASVTLDSPERVGKYGVSADALSNILPPIMKFSRQDLLYIDEIGQMEFLAEGFEHLCLRYLDAPNLCIATISQMYDNACMRWIKQRRDVILFEITPENRDAVLKEIREKIQKYS